MPVRYLTSLGAVLRAHTPEKRQEDIESGPVVRYVYRPVSFLVTPLFLAASVSANQATILGILAALAMPLAAAFLDHGHAWVACLAFVYHVMDHVDGNIARTTGQSTVAGGVLERLHAIPFWPMFLLSVGLLARNSASGFVGTHAVEIGLALATVLLVKREIQDVFEAAYPADDVQWGPAVAQAAQAHKIFDIGYLVEHTYATLLLWLAGRYHVLDAYLAVIACYIVAVFVSWIPKLLATARRHERDIPVARC